MCAPKVKTPPPPAERQAMQLPKELDVNGKDKRRYRRGFWSAVMTSPQGAPGMPSTTGTPGL